MVNQSKLQALKFILIILSFSFTNSLMANERAIASTIKKGEKIISNLDFQDANLLTVIKAFSKLTGKNFIIDPAVRGKITILAPSPMTIDEAYRTFLSALAMNNYTVVPLRGTKVLKIRKVQDAIRDSIDTYFN